MKQLHTLLSWLSSCIGKAKEVLISVFLVFIYYVLFGIFLVVVALFDRKRLWPERNPDTHWVAAEGYATYIEECMRQS